MTISTGIFPLRKRRLSAGAFIPPKFTDQRLLHSLLIMSQEISSFEPLQFRLKPNSLSILRKTKILAILLEELLRNSHLTFVSPTHLCFEEMHLLLQRIKTLLEDCGNGSKMWLLMQSESVANNFHELTIDLATLLDIFPVKAVDISEDVEELFMLLRKQCSQAKVFVDRRDCNLRHDILTMIDGIRKEIVPDHSKLTEIFDLLGLRNSLSCKEEIDYLEDDLLQIQGDEKSKSDVIALIGLVRYAKCVLFEPSTPVSDTRRKKLASEVNIPVDFRCPISLDLMRDPVVVATGQTYDRESINLWIESGHNTCPKTGQTLAHTVMIPNQALKNLIAMWCRAQKIQCETAKEDIRFNDVMKNKAALEATKMTVSYLVNKMSTLSSMEALNGVIYELRGLGKSSSESRACIGEAGAIPVLARFLGPDIGPDPSLQVNAITAMLNLSILEANKTRIMENVRALDGVIEVLLTGATWEARGNAAATIFSLSSVHSYRKRLARKTRVIKGLVDLAKRGSISSKRDALVAILNLAGDRETVGRLVEEEVVDMVNEVINVLPEEAAAILEIVVKKGGIVAVAAAYNAITKLGALMREGSELARESAAATLVIVCRKGGAEMVEELASIMGIERIIWELMGTGTMRARRKASTLLRILRRWATGFDGSTVATVSSSSRIELLSI